jgi:endonuclease/exonuclease/phosphatase family metal-dependent hydrolase
MDLHVAFLCRAPILAPRRIPLPGLHESALRAHFNLHRALFEAIVPLPGGGPLRVGNVHLSAFSGGDDTLAHQVAAVDAWMTDGAPPTLVGGDFNLLPPGDDPSRLPTDRADHPRERGTIDPFFDRHPSVLPPQGQLTPERGTYLPPGAAVPDRTLDWVFLHGGLRCERAWVEPVDPFLSDHRPVVAELVAT